MLSTVVVIETSPGQYCVPGTQKIVFLSELSLSRKHFSYVSRETLGFPMLVT